MSTLTMLFLLSPALAATLEVGPGKTYTSITAAISAAADGDTVRVFPGTYIENPDLSGSEGLTVTSTAGPWRTTIAPTTTIKVNSGTLEGFTISPSPATGIIITTGSPTVREVIVDSPATYGVAVSGGSPILEEILVKHSGLHSFIVKSPGTATIRRCISQDPADASFALNTGATVQNSLAWGGNIGFRSAGSASTLDHVVGLGQGSSTYYVGYTTSISNSVAMYQSYVATCAGGYQATLPNGIGTSDHRYSGCSATVLDDVLDVDPEFVNFSMSSELWELDLSPAAGSPMTDGGNDRDADMSTGDLGLFGGTQGDWGDRDRDGVPVLFDCDDHDANTYWGAPEIDDDLDNDCDLIVDEDIPIDTGDTGGGGDTDTEDTDTDTGDTDTPQPAYDLDGDGFAPPEDCNEHNLASYPGAPERTDGADNDCDGAIDEGTPWGDDDGDGFSEVQGDCNDNDPDIYPGAEEPKTHDALDQDCDGYDDYAIGADYDGDGYVDTEDCNDAEASINPGAEDVLNGLDDDCDGLADDPYLELDRDGDGLAPIDGDCDEDDPTVNALAFDIPDDFIDQDCTGEDNYDLDRDGNPSPKSGGTDCDDTRSTVYPGAPEFCGDGIDNNCDGIVDDTCADAATIAATEGCGTCGATGRGPAGAGLALVVSGTVACRRRRRPVTRP